jgi:hypothetical protein
VNIVTKHHEIEHRVPNIRTKRYLIEKLIFSCAVRFLAFFLSLSSFSSQFFQVAAMSTESARYDLDVFAIILSVATAKPCCACAASFPSGSSGWIVKAYNTASDDVFILCCNFCFDTWVYGICEVFVVSDV